jgi:hypothetical protein
MKVHIYASGDGRSFPRYGLLLPREPLSVLPGGESWEYVGSGDTAELGLPEAIENELQRHGFWARTCGVARPSERPDPSHFQEN